MKIGAIGGVGSKKRLVSRRLMRGEEMGTGGWAREQRPRGGHGGDNEDGDCAEDLERPAEERRTRAKK